MDIDFQPNYPFSFLLADALDLPEWGQGMLADIVAIHASPPCQASSSLRSLHPDREYPELIPATRELLIATGLPYVIENVEGAALLEPITLCGSSFGLDVRRHRLFESPVPMLALPCAHHLHTPRFRSLDARQATLATVVGVHGHLNYAGEMTLRERAMGVDWMTPAELSQAIPPAYTEHVGSYLMAEVKRRAKAAA